MKKQLKTGDSDEFGRLGVLHLKRFWSQTLAYRYGRTIETTGENWQTSRILLSGLGLSLEETMRYLLQFAPTFDEFEKWILEKNENRLENLQIERLNRILSGVSGDETDLFSFREIEEMPDVLSREDLKFWEREGYVVVREAVSETQAKAAENAVWENLGMNPNEPRSWYENAVGKGIMMEFYDHPALTENRKSPRIRKAFAQLWKTADLCTTVDRTSFNPPETDFYQFQGPHLHWDMSLEPPFRFGTQGLLYLCDTPAEQGAFCCVPSFHRKLEKWLANLPENADPREVNLNGSAVPIAARAGDFVIWHHALPHGSSPNRGRYPRIVQYINMYPPEFMENMKWR